MPNSEAFRYQAVSSEAQNAADNISVHSFRSHTSNNSNLPSTQSRGLSVITNGANAPNETTCLIGGSNASIHTVTSSLHEPPLTPPAESPNYMACSTTDGEPNGHPQPLPDPLGLRRCIKSDEELKRLCNSRISSKRRLGEFYTTQNELIEELLRPVGLSEDEMREAALDSRRVQVAIYGSVVANIILFLLQLYAAIDSGSLALFATMADAFMDLLSSVVLMLAGHEASKENLHKYPTGKSRMETIGIIVFSALMSTVSVQLMVESIRAFVSAEKSTELTAASIICVLIALATKTVLFFYCYALRKYPSADILAQDHRNDIVVNTFGLLMFLLGNHIAWWLDPSGAIIVALIILRSWTSTAFEQIQLIIGKAADPAFLQRVIYIAYTHHEAIREVDTAQAYHVGSNVYVEVDIVMDPETTLRYSHDVGESLQMKLESLPNVERAFVHVDYESEHVPEHRKDR